MKLFKNRKRKLVFLIFCILGLFIWQKYSSKPIVFKPNPVPASVIKDLAIRYKPTVVFSENTLFYPVRFDGLKKIALEIDKQVVAELEITEDLKKASNNLKHPVDLFDTITTENALIYYYSLSTKPERWQEEKVLNSFPDTLSLYVTSTFDEYLKITYTIPFEGNEWRNYHRGDGAMFAIYFSKKEGVYQPIKARSYMHLQYSEIEIEQNVSKTSLNEIKPIFFVTSGSHSTYHRARQYEDVDGLPLLNVSENPKNEFAYCSDKTELVFLDETRNNIEKWAFQGEVYWGGSPNDRIYDAEDFIGKTPVLKNLPLGNKSAKMILDPSIVFDNKNYQEGSVNIENLTINCE